MGAGSVGENQPRLDPDARRGPAEPRSRTAAPPAEAAARRAPARPRARLAPETRDAKASTLSRRPFISVLLPVRGESEELIECLASLARQTYPRSRFEILIADGSDRPVDPVIFPEGLDIHVYQNRVKTMSPGLNLLARQARGERLAIVSAHTWLPDDYLERMVATAHVTGAANVGARVRKVARSPWGRAIAAATSCPFGVGSSVQHHGAEVGPADSAFPGFIARLMFERLGGFNTELACNEDDEFNARVRAAGGLVWYDPGVEVSYRPRETLDRGLPPALPLRPLESCGGQAGSARLPEAAPRHPVARGWGSRRRGAGLDHLAPDDRSHGRRGSALLRDRGLRRSQDGSRTRRQHMADGAGLPGRTRSLRHGIHPGPPGSRSARRGPESQYAAGEPPLAAWPGRYSPNTDVATSVSESTINSAVPSQPTVNRKRPLASGPINSRSIDSRITNTSTNGSRRQLTT